MQQRWAASAAVLVLALSGRALAQSTSSTVQLSVPNSAVNGPYIISSPSNGYRGAGTGCKTSGGLSYSVTQGTSQTVNFKYDAGTVLIGGAFDDQFLGTGDGCSVTAVSVNAPDNPVNASTITSITFAPTVAVCGQFIDNSVGNLALIAFDTTTATTTSGYSAYACKFTLQFTLVPQSADSVNPAQLFPEANAAEAIPGNFLKMLGMAVVGGGLMLFMLL